MSTSDRDRDLWRLRQLTKARNALFTYPCSIEEQARIQASDEYKEIQAKFEAIFSKYGSNPDIFKEQAGSKRDAHRKAREAFKRSSKRSQKQEARQSIFEQIAEEARDA